jgi:WNK lysine deficient protein kinase
MAVEEHPMTTSSDEDDTEDNVITGGDDVIETDPGCRFHRYFSRIISNKNNRCNVWKAFDSKQGIDVAWHKFSAEEGERRKRCLEMCMELEHPNVKRCFEMWISEKGGGYNLITEHFTSGSLRQYLDVHKQLDLRAIKRIARQVLNGLNYLHCITYPVSLSDINFDDIYVNGNSGEVKIGYFLADTTREENGAALLGFGNCMSELLTHKAAHSPEEETHDTECARFVELCVTGSCSAAQLLEDPFFTSDKRINEPGCFHLPFPQSSQLSDDSTFSCLDFANASSSVTCLRGEDFGFDVTGKLIPNSSSTGVKVVRFRVIMTETNDTVTLLGAPLKRTIEFVFDPVNDTVDTIASEIADNFGLGPTDTEICAAAMREWLESKTALFVSNTR